MDTKCCNCIDGSIVIKDPPEIKPCACHCHDLSMEKIKTWRENLNHLNWEYDAIGSYFREIDWLIAEVDRGR